MIIFIVTSIVWKKFIVNRWRFKNFLFLFLFLDYDFWGILIYIATV